MQLLLNYVQIWSQVILVSCMYVEENFVIKTCGPWCQLNGSCSNYRSKVIQALFLSVIGHVRNKARSLGQSTGNPCTHYSLLNSICTQVYSHMVTHYIWWRTIPSDNRRFQSKILGQITVSIYVGRSVGSVGQSVGLSIYIFCSTPSRVVCAVSLSKREEEIISGIT